MSESDPGATDLDPTTNDGRESQGKLCRYTTLTNYLSSVYQTVPGGPGPVPLSHPRHYSEVVDEDRPLASPGSQNTIEQQ